MAQGSRPCVRRGEERRWLTASVGDPEPLRNGIDRSLGDADNGWWGAAGDWVEYRFAVPTRLSLARFTFDSNLKDTKRMPCSWPLKGHRVQIPAMMTRDLDLEVEDESGRWVCVQQVRENYQRLVRVPIEVTTRAIRFVVRRSWGGERVHVFAFDVR